MNSHQKLAATIALALFCAAAVPGTRPDTAILSLLPIPQKVNVNAPAFAISNEWHLQLGPNIKQDTPAVEAIREGFETRHHLHLKAGRSDGPAIAFSIEPGAINIETAQDRDRPALILQAYRINLSEKEIRITANASAGLFYGAETLVQLAMHRDGKIWFPTGEIVDWPDLQLREIYWDDAHHLEKLDALKHAIRQAAFYKINGFVLKLEGHFQFKSAPEVVEPYAMSRAEYQELTDYALRYYVQLIPYLDAPAHIAFILKHPEFAALRAFPDNNYELSTTNPEGVKLITAMCKDLMAANIGGNYFYLSTDEPYYLGMCESESARMKEFGSPGKLLGKFLDQVGGPIHDTGRTVVFWGEHPMKPADVAALPSFLVNGETNDADFDAAFKARGIRQMIYTSTEGEEPLFPNYAFAPADQLLHRPTKRVPRVEEAIKAIQSDAARKNGDLMGLVVAGWADMGLHPETFWLGYTTIAAAGWNPTEELEANRQTQAFYQLFYGPSAGNMNRAYVLMCHQAQFWDDSWEGKQSTARKGIWGNSNGIFKPRHPAHDQTIPLPTVPRAEDLAFDPPKQNEKKSQLIKAYFKESDELIALLKNCEANAEFNRYNIEVMQSIAQLCRQNLEMLRDMDLIQKSLNDAQSNARNGQSAKAVESLDASLDFVTKIRQSRDQTLQATVATWCQTWYPRVPEANGRKFLHELDDVKDHLPDRTIGMEYLVYRELQLPLGEWARKTMDARNQYAKAHGIAERQRDVEWVNASAPQSAPSTPR